MKSLFWASIRTLLAGLILFFNWVFTPKSVKRDADSQEQINAATQDLTLYQYKACPFCVKVRRSMKRGALNIETKDAKRCEETKQELLAGGGQLKVPCLKISENGVDRWMYESKEIISYLNDRFTIQAA
jgi:glutaredoxin